MNMQLEPEYNYCGTKSKIKLNWFEWYFIHFKKRKMKKEETENRNITEQASFLSCQCKKETLVL